MLRERKVDFEAELLELRQDLIDNPEHPQRDQIERKIASTQKLLMMIYRIIVEWGRSGSRS